MPEAYHALESDNDRFDHFDSPNDQLNTHGSHLGCPWWVDPILLSLMFFIAQVEIVEPTLQFNQRISMVFGKQPQ